jgi:hypothetical protein
MKTKKSLLKDCFSKEVFAQKTENDEMIVAVRNKISYCGLTILTALVFILGILADTFDIGLVSQYLSMAIGAVNYGMLIAFCKKGVVGHSSAVTAFIWSVITLPLSITNAFLDKIVKGMTFAIVQPIVIILIIAALYAVSNAVYKKAVSEEA